jgi:hypothetical protein
MVDRGSNRICRRLQKVLGKKIFRATQRYWLFFDGHKLLDKINRGEPLPEEVVMDGTAWDHEQCRLFWKKISEFPED